MHAVHRGKGDCASISFATALLRESLSKCYSVAMAEYFPISEVRLHHQGIGPFSSERVPVGPFASRSARRTAARAPCWTVRVPWKLLRSVAVKPGHAALTLMRVDCRSKAKASVIALRAVFDGL